MKINKLSEDFKPDRLVTLSEDLLVEGPIDWLKNKLGNNSVDPKDAQKEADKKAREKADKKIAQRKKKQDPAFLGKDFHSQNAKSTFYIDNKYDKPMTQSQFTAWWDKNQQKIADMPVATPEDIKKKEDAENKLYAQRYNAIVVNEYGRYMRRGAEPLEAKILTFVPGDNDEIKNGYFVQPYRYKKTGAIKKKTGKGAEKLNKADLAKFMSICEATGMIILDAEGKELSVSDIKQIKIEELNNHKVKIGNVQVPILDWIAKAKQKKLI